jgi:hypothetical protein
MFPQAVHCREAALGRKLRSCARWRPNTASGTTRKAPTRSRAIAANAPSNSLGPRASRNRRCTPSDRAVLFTFLSASTLPGLAGFERTAMRWTLGTVSSSSSLPTMSKPTPSTVEVHDGHPAQDREDVPVQHAVVRLQRPGLGVIRTKPSRQSAYWARVIRGSSSTGGCRPHRASPPFTRPVASSCRP